MEPFLFYFKTLLLKNSLHVDSTEILNNFDEIYFLKENHFLYG